MYSLLGGRRTFGLLLTRSRLSGILPPSLPMLADKSERGFEEVVVVGRRGAFSREWPQRRPEEVLLTNRRVWMPDAGAYASCQGECSRRWLKLWPPWFFSPGLFLPSRPSLNSSAMLQELSHMDRITQLQDEIQQACLHLRLSAGLFSCVGLAVIDDNVEYHRVPHLPHQLSPGLSGDPCDQVA